jgi:hypothetical protein
VRIVNGAKFGDRCGYLMPDEIYLNAVGLKGVKSNVEYICGGLMYA